MIDPYSALGVAQDADFETIRAAYRRLVRENHPDVAPDKAAATSRMAHLNEVWNLIGAPEKRAAFDSRLKLQKLEEAARAVSEERQRQEAQRRARQEQEKHGRSHSRHHVSSGSSTPTVPSRSSKSSAAHKTSTRRVPTVDGISGATKRSSQEKNPARDGRVLRKMTLASQLFHRDGKLEESAAICRSVLLADGRNVPARELLGDILAQQGRIETALIMFDQAIQIAPHDRMLRRKRERLQNRQNRHSQKAHAEAVRAASAKPRQSWLGRLWACFSK